MFVFMGNVLERSGIGDDLLQCLRILLRRVPGGLAIGVTLLGIIMAATTGIIGASVVMLTLLALPTMVQKNYNVPLAAGTIAASGTLGILIPPSIMLIFMADMLSISVIGLFMAALLPGLMLGGLYLAYITIVSILIPSLAPRLGDEDDEALLSEPLLPLVFRSFLPPVALITLVLGSIFAGFVTVTESAGVGAGGALALAWLKGRLNYRLMRDVIDRTLLINAMIFGVLMGATAFSYVFRILGGDHMIVEALTGLGLEGWGLLFLIMAAIFVMGFFFDWIEITLIVLPIIAPVLRIIDLGDHIAEQADVVVWVAILIAVNLQTSFLTPPLGFAILYVKGSAPMPLRLEQLFAGVVPFVLLQLFGLALIMAFPGIALWLPNAMMR